jgi:hypothetical protein
VFVTYGYCTEKLKLVALRRAVGLITNKQSPPKCYPRGVLALASPAFEDKKFNRRLKLFMRKRMVMLERCGVVAFRVPLIENVEGFYVSQPSWR